MSQSNHQKEFMKIFGGTISGVLILLFSHIGLFFLFVLIASILDSIPFTRNLEEIFSMVMGRFFMALFITQLVYAIPLYMLMKRRKYRHTAQGIIVGAVITALVSGSCFVLFAQF